MKQNSSNDGKKIFNPTENNYCFCVDIKVYNNIASIDLIINEYLRGLF